MRRLAVAWVLAMATACGAAPSQPASTAVTTIAPAVATASTAPTLAASPTARAAALVIEMGDHFFDPAQLTVKAGSTVTWKSVGCNTRATG